MRLTPIAVAAFATTTLFTVGIATANSPLAAAQPNDYSNLPIDPNDITDDDCVFTQHHSTPNPNGQLGVETVFMHNDGTRQITDTILVFPDPAAATIALDAARAALGVQVPGVAPQPAPVGAGGTMISGLTPDRSRSLAVLLFTEGNAFATLKFEGPPNDPAPPDQIIGVGQTQAAEIREGLI